MVASCDALETVYEHIMTMKVLSTMHTNPYYYTNRVFKCSYSGKIVPGI